MTVGEFAEHVSDLCYLFNGSVTSWGRSAKRNAEVGGLEKSRHLDFLAVDVVLDTAALNPHFAEWALRRGLKVLDEGDHLHVQPMIG